MQDNKLKAILRGFGGWLRWIYLTRTIFNNSVGTSFPPWRLQIMTPPIPTSSIRARKKDTGTVTWCSNGFCLYAYSYLDQLENVTKISNLNFFATGDLTPEKKIHQLLGCGSSWARRYMWHENKATDTECWTLSTLHPSFPTFSNLYSSRWWQVCDQFYDPAQSEWAGARWSQQLKTNQVYAMFRFNQKRVIIMTFKLKPGGVSPKN